jgi:hypothetical protein
MFVRVAHRQGWDVEVVGGAGEVAVETLPSRVAALDRARSLEPDWIEVGDIVGLGTESQHHSWTTLRRRPDGTYAPSGLRWGGKA